MIKIKFKKLSNKAIIPTKGRDGDACFDLYATENLFITDNEPWLVKTNIAMEIPEGYFGKIYTRSGMAKKGWQTIWWVLDSNYRGDIWVLIRYTWKTFPDTLEVMNKVIKWIEIKAGDRVAQLAIHKVEDVEFEEVDELTETTRWEAGYGSSGV